MDEQVLVVEDERDVADLYADWLRDDYEPLVAHDAAAALDLLDDRLDVVLLDRRLPDGSGDEVLAAIRDRSLACQVAMVTAVEPDVDVVDMGFDAYLVKPVGREALLATVERLLRRTAYDEQVREHVALVSKKAALETQQPTGRLSGSEAYTRLKQDIAASRATLDDLLSDLEGEDFTAVMRSLTAGTGVQGGEGANDSEDRP